MSRPRAEPAELFDYVVVGSGAGGGPVAANLAEAGHRVLLLEAGLDPEDDDYRVPAFHGRASESPGMSWPYFVRHYDDDARQRRDGKYVPEQDGVLYPRSGTLGGCTAHNAMITMVPHDSDWDGIARLTGDRSWRAPAMRRWFERVEACGYVERPKMLPRWHRAARLFARLPLLSDRYVNRGRHGFRGWLHTSLPDPELALGDSEVVSVITAAVLRHLADFLERPLHPIEGLAGFVDPNDWRVRGRQEGAWFIPLAVRAGNRNGTRERIREVAARLPDRLVVRTGALVTKVLLEGPDGAVTARGVEYLRQDHAYRVDPVAASSAGPAADGEQAGERRTVRVRREVVLAAGAFNTPQLLKLSGIGPRAELDRFGIPCRVDRPGVGENLQDRYEVGVVSKMTANFRLLSGLTFCPPAAGQPGDAGYREWQQGRGVYTTNGALLGVIRRSRRELTDPDLFVFGLPTRFTGYYPGYSGALAQHQDLFTWAVLKAHTANRAGSVLLRSADPCDPPDIRFRYFQEGSDAGGADLDAVVTGIEVARSIMHRVDDYVDRELVPGDGVRTREDLREFVRDNAWGHHASCTAAIGPGSDPHAVVGSDFRVHGTTGLRVVDASIFPRIPGFFVVTAIYMAAEKASSVIAAAAGSFPAGPQAGSQQPAVERARVLDRLPRPRLPHRSGAVAAPPLARRTHGHPAAQENR